jgi:hypothetical protein
MELDLGGVSGGYLQHILMASPPYGEPMRTTNEFTTSIHAVNS